MKNAYKTHEDETNVARQERSASVLVKVTEREKVTFMKAAEKRHTNLSELIRQLLHAEAESQAQKA